MELDAINVFPDSAALLAKTAVVCFSIFVNSE